MKNHADFEEKTEKKFLAKDKRKTNKMKVSGKSVIDLKKIITKKANY